MFRMIRSARSHLTRDGSSDDAALAAPGAHQTTQPGTVRWYLDPASRYIEEEERIPADRHQRRFATARPTLLGRGSTRQRLPRSTAGKEDSENVALPLPHAASAPMAVLSDVTNTTAGQQFHLQCGQTQQGAINKKTLGICSEAGAPLQAVVPAAQPAATAFVSLFSDTAEAGAARGDGSEDPQQASEYVADIFAVLHREEGGHMPQPDYMDGQLQVNAKMRGILIDWLVDVHKKYKLKPETLYLTVSLIDRFLERRATARRFLQLVGVSALLVASKFEELNPPQVQDFVYVTDNSYSREEVMRMEVSILTALDFKICSPTAVPFLERLHGLNGCDEVHADLTRYLLELTVVDYKMVKYPPSHLAAAAVLLSNKLLRQKPSWSSEAAKATGLTEHMLKECVKEIIGLLENAERNGLQAVRKKYSQPMYHEVAKAAFMCGSHAPSMQAEENKTAASEVSLDGPDKESDTEHTSGGGRAVATE